MATLVERRSLSARHAIALAAGIVGAGAAYVGAPEVAVFASTLGLATLATGAVATNESRRDTGLVVLRAIAGRSAVAAKLEGAIAASLEELVRHTGSTAAVTLVRRGEGGLCDAHFWLDGRLSSEELIWQPELAQPMSHGDGLSPRLPTRLGRARKWMSRPIVGRGEVRGAIVVLEPRQGEAAWLTHTLTVLGAHIGALVVGEQFDERLTRGYVGTIESLVTALEAKDTYTAGHSQRVSRYAVAIASEVGFPEDEKPELQTGAMLHDIGKIGVGDGVLSKPGRLSDDELDEIRDHPRRGARIIDAFNRSSTVLSVVFHHHERYDGKGYPAGLRGVDIPLAARIVNVADAFDAMTTNRPYGKTKTKPEALTELQRGAGTQFDPRVVEALQRVVEQGAA